MSMTEHDTAEDVGESTSPGAWYYTPGMLPERLELDGGHYFPPIEETTAEQQLESAAAMEARAAKFRAEATALVLGASRLREFAASREDVAAAVKDLRAEADDQEEDLVKRAVAEYAWDALEGPAAWASSVDEHGWPTGLAMPANTSIPEHEDGELYVVLENVNDILAVVRSEDDGSLTVLGEDEWPERLRPVLTDRRPAGPRAGTSPLPRVAWPADEGGAAAARRLCAGGASVRSCGRRW